MKVGGTLLAFLVFLAPAMAIPCAFQLQDLLVDIEPGCPNGMPINRSQVYIHEDFYICGKLPGMTGAIKAYEPTVMPNQTVSITNYGFTLHGKADTEEHKVYYINVNYTDCEFKPILLEVKNKCDQVAPTVKILPGNVIEEGNSFTVEVTHLEKDFDISLSGLKNPVKANAEKNSAWSMNFSSSDCCENPPCECIIKLEFTDSAHPICKDDQTTFKITVKEEGSTTTTETNNLFIILAVAIVIVGTGIAIAYNRR